MEKNSTQTNTEKKEGFFDKVKNGLVKFFKGVKNFFVKTARVNGTHCYGVIEGIGDFLVYDDHALISAVGMDDVTFTGANVASWSFEGLGRIRRSKATVKYKIVLDDNVVFPQKVREKNDVKNLTATIFIENERSHLLGRGKMERDQGNRGMPSLEDCDVYGYSNCLVIVLKLKKQVGEKVEHYQESVLYPFSDVSYVGEQKDKSLVVKFNDAMSLIFTPLTEGASQTVKKIKENA